MTSLGGRRPTKTSATSRRRRSRKRCRRKKATIAPDLKLPEERHFMAKNGPTEERLDELREAFDYNDRDSDGRIQLDELESEMSRRDIEIGFKDIDTNDDGLIDFDEFVAWWTEV